MISRNIKIINLYRHFSFTTRLFFFQNHLCPAFLFQKNIFVYMKKKRNRFLFICPLRLMGGGGLKALADMSAKSVIFFGHLPLQVRC